ncbi:DUF3306 domain-containing protein [Antarctobacter heliothermus]|uniref:DUF3306 domain-containing protein n=1 Tax=Antarctobacter heliothermus TaxID=74033 RepID=A0A239F9U8_9RHOB|nr:DUF3306 domain-containing protein [Antarctobacter heliothermus]SNS53686.1 Protein of unknown function [Antarctobacter heliothermus]
MSATSGDFWSRRRAQVAKAEAAEVQAAEVEARAAEDAKLEQRPDEEILADLDLPAPEEMVSTEQVQKLLKAAVPQRLKTRALRRMWRLNPVLANVDGLVDYGEDYTDAAVVVENLQTLYKVGKGMFDKAVEAAEAEAAALAKAEAKEADSAEAPDQAGGDDVPEADPIADTHTQAAADVDPGKTDLAEDVDAASAQTPRRMRFRFETAT